MIIIATFALRLDTAINAAEKALTKEMHVLYAMGPASALIAKAPVELINIISY